MPKTPKKPTALARRKPAPAPRGPREEPSPAPGELADAAYAGASRAENTKRAYTTDFVAFSAWCGEQGLESLPALPRTVAPYLTTRAVAEKKVAPSSGRWSPSTRRTSFPSPRKAPEVTEVLQGIRRTLGVAPNQKDPVLVDTLRALIEPMRKEDPELPAQAG